jgi:hypothetical protein
MSQVHNPAEQTNTALDEIQENAIGTINGINVVFTSSVPMDTSTLKVYLNGQLVRSPDTYSITNTSTVTMVDAPQNEPGNEDVLTLIYIPA